MFKFIKKIFISSMMYFGNLSSANSLKCISMNNQECKVNLKLLMLIVMNLYFIFLVLKQVNVVVVVTILMIYMQNYAFQILLKI